MTSRTLIAGIALAGLAAGAGVLALRSDDPTSLATSASGTPTTAAPEPAVQSLRQLPPLDCETSEGAHLEIWEGAYQNKATPSTAVGAAVDYLEDFLPGLAVPAVTDNLQIVSHSDPSLPYGFTVVEHQVAGQPVLRFMAQSQDTDDGPRYIVSEFSGCTSVTNSAARED